MRLAAIILLTASAACTSFPALDDRLTAADRAAPFPQIVPLAPLLAEAQAATGTQITPASVAAMDARIAALRSRAAGLRGPVIEPRIRDAMRAAARRAALR